MAKAKLTPTDTITDRLEAGREFVRRFRLNDARSMQRFIDPSAQWVGPISQDDEGGSIPIDSPEGNVNWLMVNTLTKVATVTIGDPDFHPDCDADVLSQIPLEQAEGQQVIRQLLVELWSDRNWARTSRMAYLKRCISGLGCVATLWDDGQGPVLEHVATRDLVIDPHVTDWSRLRWAARRIRLPKDVAEQMYGSASFAVSRSESHNDDLSATQRNTVELWCYWDMTTEAVLYGSDVIDRTANLYGRIPLRFILGDLNPDSPLPLGDYNLATGIQQMLTDGQDLVNAQARHGGGVGWYRPEAIGKADQEALQTGHPQQFIGIEGMEGNQAIGFTASQPMSDAVLEALKMAMNGLDAVTGVSEYQRGVTNEGVKFATEAALLANRSGARGTQAKTEFEKFVEALAKDVLDLLERFGNPSGPQDMLLYTCIQSVKSVVVMEGSTEYKDPAFEMQSSIQLLQVMMPFMQMGIVNPIQMIKDVFRAFGRRDVDKYLTPQAQGAGQMGQPMMPGQMAAPGVIAATPGAPPGPQPPAGPAPASQQGQMPVPGAVQGVMNRAALQ